MCFQPSLEQLGHRTVPQCDQLLSSLDYKFKSPDIVSIRIDGNKLLSPNHLPLASPII
jgi:hypothetical protein